MLDFRALDGGDHLRVALIAALENRDHLADRHLLSGDIPDGDLEALDRVRRRNVAGDGSVEIRDRSLQSARSALDAIDAKADVEQRSDNWRQPGNPDPCDGRGHFALMGQRVDGNRRGYHDMQEADKDRTADEQRNLPN